MWLFYETTHFMKASEESIHQSMELVTISVDITKYLKLSQNMSHLSSIIFKTEWDA